MDCTSEQEVKQWMSTLQLLPSSSEQDTLTGKHTKSISTHFSNIYQSILIADSLLPYIYNQALSTKYTSYEQMLGQLKLTERQSNNSSVTKSLQHITWTLNININIIGFKHTKYVCQCQQHSSNCYYQYYIFQNPLVKLLTSTLSITIMQWKHKFYIYNADQLHPYLINKQNDYNIPFSASSIWDILHNIPIALAYNVILYSSYSYIRKSSVRLLQNSIIAQYKCNNDSNTQTIHIFVSPALTKDKIRLNMLDCPSIPSSRSMGPVSHVHESMYLKKRQRQQIDKIQNQEFCICQHPKTARMFIPTKKHFKPLGKHYISMFLWFIF